LVSLLGCASSVKEFVPIHTSSLPVRVPNQQRLVSLAAQQAVTAAAREINLAQYAGLSGRVEINGVFPHSANDLLEYVASAVEFEMARVGMRVLSHPIMAPVRSEAIASAPVIMMREPGAEAAPQPDLRVIASLDWGGIDFKDQQYTVWSRAGAMLGIALGGIVTGAIIMGAGYAASQSTGRFGVTTTDDSIFIPSLAVGGILFVGGPLIAGIWRALDKPVGHQLTLTGRVRIALKIIPNTAGQRPALSTGDGESHIVIDTRSESGYTNIIDVPEPKK
jgi:hypothetical protein